MMSSKCSACVYGKAHYSEETGYDYICSLPDPKERNDCIIGKGDFYKESDEETRMFMVPFCEKCGHPIMEKIGINRVEKTLNSSNTLIDYHKYFYGIYPQVCPNCKARFTAITIPEEKSLYNGGYDAKEYLLGGVHLG